LAPDHAALEARISTLINALYASKDQGRVFARFAQVKADLSAGRTDAATADIVAFFRTSLADLNAGVLLDPNGSQPPATADALRDLLNSVAELGGLGSPLPASNPLAGDGAVAVVGPSGGTVVTSSGFGGVRFPVGALPSDVIVVIARLPNPTVVGQGPLPTDFDQYPLYDDFSTTPAIAHFAQPVTVALCRLEVGDDFGPPNQEVADRLQVAHPDPAEPTTVELLPVVDGSFVHCNGVSLSSAAFDSQREGFAGRALGLADAASRRVLALFLPTPAYAVHGGLGGLTSSFSPFATVDPRRLHFASVAAGERHTCALTTGGQAWCWGDNSSGGLGDGSTTNRLVPTQVATTLRFTKISANNAFTCALGTDSHAYCWGANRFGQLGTGDVTSRFAPTPVSGALSFTDIGTGAESACGLTGGGAIWCWGWNQYGQLGATSSGLCDSGATQVACNTTPIRAAGSMTFASLDVGFWTACGIVPSGQAWCWGNGTFGQFGSGASSIISTQAPILAANGMALSRIFQSAIEGCGFDQAGKPWCWGANISGDIGDGTTTTRQVPAAVAGDISFSSLVLKDANNILGTTCATTAAGDAYCWGSNSGGELGASAPDQCPFGAAGTIPCALQPVHVAGSQHFTQLSIGNVHTCGVTIDHAIYCWGTGTSGQLGTGTTDPQPTPVPTVHSF
jgi:alpha-tubulin suppressor-like RCC1 family protein